MTDILNNTKLESRKLKVPVAMSAETHAIMLSALE